MHSINTKLNTERLEELGFNKEPIGSDFPTDSQLLNAAVDFIVDGFKDKEYRVICNELELHEENKYMCEMDCQGLCRLCVLRFLKYKHEKRHEV